MHQRRRYHTQSLFPKTEFRAEHTVASTTTAMSSMPTCWSNSARERIIFCVPTGFHREPIPAGSLGRTTSPVSVATGGAPTPPGLPEITTGTARQFGYRRGRYNGTSHTSLNFGLIPDSRYRTDVHCRRERRSRRAER